MSEIDELMVDVIMRGESDAERAVVSLIRLAESGSLDDQQRKLVIKAIERRMPKVKSGTDLYDFMMRLSRLVTGVIPQPAQSLTNPASLPGASAIDSAIQMLNTADHETMLSGEKTLLTLGDAAVPALVSAIATGEGRWSHLMEVLRNIGTPRARAGLLELVGHHNERYSKLAEHYAEELG